MKETGQDINGKASSKRKWAAIILRYAIIYTSVVGTAKLLIVFGVLTPVMEYEVDTGLIIGLFTVGAGLFGVTTWERASEAPSCTEEPPNDNNEGRN